MSQTFRVPFYTDFIVYLPRVKSIKFLQCKCGDHLIIFPSLVTPKRQKSALKQSVVLEVGVLHTSAARITTSRVLEWAVSGYQLALLHTMNIAKIFHGSSQRFCQENLLFANIILDYIIDFKRRITASGSVRDLLLQARSTGIANQRIK